MLNGYAGTEYFCDREEETQGLQRLKQLLERDLITREQNSYSIYDQFFALWIRSRLLKFGI